MRKHKRFSRSQHYFLSVVCVAVLVTILSFSVLSALASSSTSKPSPTPTKAPSPTPSATPISTLTPTPTPTSKPTNLAPLPTGWSYPYTGQSWGIGGPTPTAVLAGDYQGKTNVMQMYWTQYYVNQGYSATCEVDSSYIPLNVGDHVVLSAWFYVPDSTVGENGIAYTGGALRLDLRSANGRICEIGTPSGAQTEINGVYNPDGYLTFVEFGTKTWTQITIDFTVQSSYVADGWGGLPAGTVATPNGMIAFLTIGATNLQNEQDSVYVADTAIYVNP